MTRRSILSGALAFAAAAGLVARAQTPQSQTVFRSATDLVTIDVAVRASGTPVGGLRASDFLLLDNGVRQDVEAVELEAVPVDITILIDASGDMADHIADEAEQARKIAAMARPTDRVRVMQFGTYINDAVRAQPAAGLPDIAKPKPSGLPSAHDAIAMALLRRVEPGRRHLVIAITNGIDAISTLDAASVRDIARHSSATLVIAQVDIAFDEPTHLYKGGRERLQEHRGPAMIISQKRPFWRPYDDEQFEVLDEAAAATGGARHLPGVFIDRNASAIFEKVFADYQRSYVLRYTPQGVARVGWHTVKVTIPKYGSYTVHARPGYSVEPGGPAAVTAAPAVMPAPIDAIAAAPPISTIAGLKVAYDAADYGGVTAALRAAAAAGPAAPPTLVDLIRDFGRGGNPWPANPHREAVFVLELADAAIGSGNAAAADAAARLLPVYARLVRDPLGPGDFERTWLQAALALLDRDDRLALAPRLGAEALARFPGEPQFLEARAAPGGRIAILGAAHDSSAATLYGALIAQLRDRTR